MKATFFSAIALVRGRAPMLRAAWLLAAFCGGGWGEVAAQTPDDNYTYAYFLGPKFNAANASVDGTKTMKINKSAALTTDNGGAIRLVLDVSYDQSGNTFLSHPIYSETGFSAMFEIYMGTADNARNGGPGDGWAFIVAKSTEKVGSTSGGSSLGYLGAPNSFAMGFDTYCNNCYSGSSSKPYDTDHNTALPLVRTVHF